MATAELPVNVINTTTGAQNPGAFGGGDQEQYLTGMVALDGTPAGNLIFTVGQQGSLGAEAGYWPAPRVDSFHAPGQFYDGVFTSLGTPDENLVGLALTETWNRNFAHNLKFTESLMLTPTFNFVQAYSGVATTTLAVP